MHAAIYVGKAFGLICFVLFVRKSYHQLILNAFAAQKVGWKAAQRDIATTERSEGGPEGPSLWTLNGK